MGNPFKVVHLVIVFVPIFVVYFKFYTFWFMDECLRNQPVYLPAYGFVINMKHDCMVSVMLFGLWHYPYFVTA